jgi:DNA-binding LytR/AlgR family response regulator
MFPELSSVRPDAENVTHVTAERNYVRVHLNNGANSRVRGVLEQWQGSLANWGFVRLGRSALVNLAAVQQVERVGRDLTLVYILNAQRPLRLGRRASRQLKTLLSQRPVEAARDGTDSHV